MNFPASFETVPDSWPALVVAGLLLLLLGMLLTAIGRFLLLKVMQPYPAALTLFRFSEQPMRLLLPVLVLNLLWYGASDSLHGITLVRQLTALVLTAAITWLGVRVIAAIGEAIVTRHPSHHSDNLAARRIHTQTRLLTRSLMFVVILIGVSAGLMIFPNVRQIGTSLLASAGIAGLVIGLAAKPVLGNLLAGLQIALTQPIRLDDVVIVQGEWGWVEEITGTYVVVRIWDERRMVVPLQWFIENPFQNWTRTSARIIGSVFLWVDYRMPLEPLREEARRLCETASEWDQRVCLIQITDASERAMQLRVLVSSPDSPRNWDLRCRVREGLVEFAQREYPGYLPRLRVELDDLNASQADAPAAAPSS